MRTDVEMVRDGYGEFKFLVNGETATDRGAAAFLGVLPSGPKTLATIRAKLSP
ncbi:MAG TPA: hypothetical protein VEX68_14480 [Bryobacteraceae bacterium]|nr:hypothetical protein [Bryobacteraceae bacterium]